MVDIYSSLPALPSLSNRCASVSHSSSSQSYSYFSRALPSFNTMSSFANPSYSSSLTMLNLHAARAGASARTAGGSSSSTNDWLRRASMDSPRDNSHKTSPPRKRPHSSTTTSSGSNGSDTKVEVTKTTAQLAEDAAKRIRLAFPAAVPRALRVPVTATTTIAKPAVQVSSDITPPTQQRAVKVEPSLSTPSSTIPVVAVVKDEPVVVVAGVAVDSVPFVATPAPAPTALPSTHSSSSSASLPLPPVSSSMKDEPRSLSPPSSTNDDMPPPLERPAATESPSSSIPASTSYAYSGTRVLPPDGDSKRTGNGGNNDDHDNEPLPPFVRSARVPNTNHIRGFYCDTCGERITSMSEADHVVTTLHNFNKRMTRPPSVVRAQAEANAAAEADNASSRSTSSGEQQQAQPVVRRTLEERQIARAQRRVMKKNVATLEKQLDLAIRRDLFDLRT